MDFTYQNVSKILNTNLLSMQSRQLFNFHFSCHAFYKLEESLSAQRFAFSSRNLLRKRPKSYFIPNVVSRLQAAL